MAYVAICCRQDVPSVYCSHLVEESVYQQTRGRPLYMRMVADYAARAASRPAFRELLYDLYDDFNYDGVAGVYLWQDLCMRIPGRWTRKNHFYHDFCKKWAATCREAFFCGVADEETLMKRTLRYFFTMCRPHATGPEREYCANFLIPSFDSLFVAEQDDLMRNMDINGLRFLEAYVDVLPPAIFAIFAEGCHLQQTKANLYTSLCRALKQTRNQDYKYCDDLPATSPRQGKCRSMTYPDCDSRNHTKLINCYKTMAKECSVNEASPECGMLKGAYYGNPDSASSPDIAKGREEAQKICQMHPDFEFYAAFYMVWPSGGDLRKPPLGIGEIPEGVLERAEGFEEAELEEPRERYGHLDSTDFWAHFNFAKCDFMIRSFVDVLGPQVYQRLCVDAKINRTIPVYCRLLYQYIHIDLIERYLPDDADIVVLCQKHFRRCINSTLAICDVLWEKAPPEFDGLLANIYSHECMGHSHIVTSDRKYCRKIIAVCSKRNSPACRSVGRASAVKTRTEQNFIIYIIGFGPVALVLIGLFWCCPYAEIWYQRRQYHKMMASYQREQQRLRRSASSSTRSIARISAESMSQSAARASTQSISNVSHRSTRQN
ncbi:unnamed protein product, partial [Mesorhabditis spiculigera]